MDRAGILTYLTYVLTSWLWNIGKLKNWKDIYHVPIWLSVWVISIYCFLSASISILSLPTIASNRIIVETVAGLEKKHKILKGSKTKSDEFEPNNTSEIECIWKKRSYGDREFFKERRNCSDIQVTIFNVSRIEIYFNDMKSTIFL